MDMLLRKWSLNGNSFFVMNLNVKIYLCTLCTFRAILPFKTSYERKKIHGLIEDSVVVRGIKIIFYNPPKCTNCKHQNPKNVSQTIFVA